MEDFLDKFKRRIHIRAHLLDKQACSPKEIIDNILEEILGEVPERRNDVDFIENLSVYIDKCLHEYYYGENNEKEKL